MEQRKRIPLGQFGLFCQLAKAKWTRAMTTIAVNSVQTTQPITFGRQENDIILPSMLYIALLKHSF